MNNSELQNLAHEYRKELFEKFVKGTSILWTDRIGTKRDR